MKWRMESLNGKGTQRRLIARDGVHREGERIRKVSPTKDNSDVASESHRMRSFFHNASHALYNFFFIEKILSEGGTGSRRTK